MRSGTSCVYMYICILLIIPEEDFVRKPAIIRHLESLLNTRNVLHLIFRELPTFRDKVCFNAFPCNRFREDACATLDSPRQKHLMHSNAVLFSDPLEKCI